MNELMTKEIFERIDLLAAKIGTTAETVWPWFVKQQYIEAELFSYLYHVS